MSQYIGPLLVTIGIGHAVLGAVLFPDALLGILEDGVFDTIRPAFVADAQFDRIAALFFVLFGPMLVVLGQLMSRAIERNDASTVRTIAWYLLGIGITGAPVVPISGFWLLIGFALLSFRAAHRLHAPTRVAPTTPRTSRVS